MHMKQKSLVPQKTACVCVCVSLYDSDHCGACPVDWTAACLSCKLIINNKNNELRSLG